MYDPTTGRWLIEDPIGFDAGDMDLYRYVGNNPTNEVDPSGEAGFGLDWGIPGLVWDTGWRFITGEEPGIVVKVAHHATREVIPVKLSKSAARAIWVSLSYKYGDNAGKPISGMMFRWSLQDNPKSLTFRTNSPVAAAIKTSPEYKSGVGKCVAEAIDNNKTHGYMPIEFKSNDLATSIGNGTLEYKVIKITDSDHYELQVRVYDRFNFELHPFLYYNSIKIGGANNASWLSQYLDIINAYDWNTEWWTEKRGMAP